MSTTRRYRWSVRITVLFGLLLLLSYTVSYWSYASSPFVAVLGLLVPVLMVINCGIYLYWLLRRKKVFSFPLLVLIVGYLTVGSVYEFGPAPKEATDSSFSLMSYNVRNFNKNEELPLQNVDSLIVDFVREDDPDILCLQECHYAMKRSSALNQYPYRFVDFIYSYEIKHDHVIQAVYSKYPLLNIRSIDFPESANKAIAMDVVKGKDTLRLINVHLQSFSIIPEVGKLQQEQSDRLLKRVEKVLVKQQQQATLLRAEIEKSPFPVVVVGDFNNNQFSFAYREIKGDLTDSFSKAGKGFGQTYNLMGFPMRIDFILTDPRIKTLSYTSYKNKLSDHYPIRAELDLGQGQEAR